MVVHVNAGTKERRLVARLAYHFMLPVSLSVCCIGLQ